MIIKSLAVTKITFTLIISHVNIVKSKESCQDDKRDRILFLYFIWLQRLKSNILHFKTRLRNVYFNRELPLTGFMLYTEYQCPPATV